MRKSIAVTLAIAAVALSGCAGRDVKVKEGSWQNTVNEATVSTGGGDTGFAGTAAAGPSVNSEGRREAAREAAR